MNNQNKTREELTRELQELQQRYDTLKVSFEQDIAERKQVEEALRQSERNYRLLAHNSSDVIWTLDNDFRFTYISPSIYQLRGLTVAEAMHETIEDTMPPHSQQLVYETILRGKENENKRKYSPVRIEIEQYHKDRHLVWVEVSLRAMLNEQGEKIGYVAASRDITDRKMTEIALRQSEENFRSLADTAKVVISIVANTDGSKFLYVNDEWSRVYGYSKEEAKNLSPIDLVAPDMRQQILDRAIDRMQGKSTPYNYELKTITKSGVTKYFDFSPTIIKFENHRAFLTTSIDLTERKRVEETLRENDVKLRELIAQKDKFFSIIAHDLKSPFNSIIGFSELLMEQIAENDYNEIDKFARIIKESSKQAMDLLMNLLEWSRAQIGMMPFHPESFNLTDSIAETVRLFDFIAAQKAITMHQELSSEVMIMADKQMISTVLRNLISNAIKFTAPGGKINLAVEKSKQAVLISVKDNGTGIAPERLEKLFQIDESDSTLGTNDEKGTGLGLVLCKEFIDKHNGKIWADSRLGEGSTFYVTLLSPAIP